MINERKEMIIALNDVLSVTDLRHTVKERMYKEANATDIGDFMDKTVGAVGNMSIRAATATIQLLTQAMRNITAIPADFVKKPMDMLYVKTTSKMYETILKSCNDITGNKKNGKKALDTYNDLMDIVDKVGKISNTSGMTFMKYGVFSLLLDATVDLNDVVIKLSMDPTFDVDGYLFNGKDYRSSLWNTITKFNATMDKDKIFAELSKENQGTEDLSHYYAGMSARTQAMIGEADSSGVSILRVAKAMLFKGFFTLLAPVRFGIYMLLYCKYTVLDKIKFIQDTIAIYDGSIKPSAPMSRDNLVAIGEKRVASMNVDRSNAYAKAENKITEDSKSITTTEKSAPASEDELEI